MASRSKTVGAVQLSKSQWEDIYAALATQKHAVYDAAWAVDLGQIMAEIGPDGKDAAERGVEAVR